MKTTPLFIVTALALALAGCNGDLGQNEREDESEEPGVAEASAALIDSSGIYALGALQRPAGLFSPAGKLTNANISGTQLEQEALSFTDLLGSATERYQSAHFRVVKRAPEGALQIVRREEQWVRPSEDPTVQPGVLTQAAVTRFSALGIGASEIYAIRQRKTMMVASEDKVHRLHSHVTVFERGFNGIPVRGSHGSVIFDRAGHFSKLLLHWRPVAPDSAGNQWGTSMTPAQIVARATQVIADKGLSSRNVTLRYAYVPQAESADGSSTFALRCMAHVNGIAESDLGAPDRPEEIEIPLDP